MWHENKLLHRENFDHVIEQISSGEMSFEEGLGALNNIEITNHESNSIGGLKDTSQGAFFTYLLPSFHGYTMLKAKQSGKE